MLLVGELVSEVLVVAVAHDDGVAITLDDVVTLAVIVAQPVAETETVAHDELLPVTVAL